MLRAGIPRLWSACWSKRAGTAIWPPAPIVRDIIKAYYDKKAKKGQGQYTVDYQKHEFGNGSRQEVAENPKAVSKAEQSAAVVPGDPAEEAAPQLKALQEEME